MKKTPLLLLLGLVLPAVLNSNAAETASKAGLPPARDVIARFVEAIGGKDAVLKHSSMAIKGKWNAAGMGEGDFELLKTKPNRQLIRIKLGEQGQIVTVYDGKIGWTVNPFAGATLMEGKLLQQTADEAEFYSILHRDTDFKSMETVGPARMDGKDCIELKVVTKSGREIREFYDTKSGLLTATKGIQESPQGPNEVTLIYADYKKFDDLLQATRMQIQAGALDWTTTISSVDFDKVSDKEFDVPADVQALIKK